MMGQKDGLEINPVNSSPVYSMSKNSIVWFKKNMFAVFLTGSDRIPILGMKAVKMIIQPTHGGNSYLPVAHTCFNLLDLPKYQDYRTMKEKLCMAIEQTEGFGIV